jgi:predicted nucleic acid-binding protein
VNVAIDTNLLAYAEGVNGRLAKDAALQVLEALPPESTFIPVQVLGELFYVLSHKARWSKAKAAGAVLSWEDAFPLIETSSNVLLAATDLTRAHQLGVWDAVIVSAAADARCRILLSEDLQEGFTWHGVTVTNPMVAERHPLLDALLSNG